MVESTPASPANLRARRRNLNATVEIMAIGIGLRRADIREIERLEASDGMLNHYAAWLARIERWTQEERDRQFIAAKTGRRFWIGKTRSDASVEATSAEGPDA